MTRIHHYIVSFTWRDEKSTGLVLANLALRQFASEACPVLFFVLRVFHVSQFASLPYHFRYPSRGTIKDGRCSGTCP